MDIIREELLKEETEDIIMEPNAVYGKVKEDFIMEPNVVYGLATENIRT